MFGKVRRFLQITRESNFSLVSSAMAFNSTLSLIPLLAIALATFKYLGGFQKVQTQILPIFFQYLTVGTSPEFLEKINFITNKASGKVLSTAGFVVFFFTSAKLIFHLDQSIQQIWGFPRIAKVGKRIFYYVIFLFVAPLGFSFLIGYVGFYKWVNFKYFPFEIYFYGFLFFIVFFLNQLVPPTKVRLRYSFLTAIFVTLGLFSMHKIFFWISKNMIIYNKIYGSFASIPIFLLWLQWCWQVFFFGVLLCSLFNKKYFDRKNIMRQSVGLG